MWSHECSPVRTTVANAKSMMLLLWLYSSCQACHYSWLYAHVASFQVIRIEIVRKVVREL